MRVKNISAVQLKAARDLLDQVIKIRDHRLVEFERISRYTKLKPPPESPRKSLVEEIKHLAGSLKHTTHIVTDSDLAKLKGNLSAEKFQLKLLELSVAELQGELREARSSADMLKAERDHLDAEIPELQCHTARVNDEQDKLSAQLLEIATGASDEFQGLLEAVETKKRLLEQMTLEREMVDYETLKIMAEIRYAQSLLGETEPPIAGGYPHEMHQARREEEDGDDAEERRIIELINKIKEKRNTR